jgi:hypothetical protein
MVSGLKDGATLKLYDYDLDDLTENGTASFGSATDTELDNRTRGIFPMAKPMQDEVWYLRGRDGNNVQVQYNDRNGTLGWQDLGPGTATWDTAKYIIALLTAPMISDDIIVAFADDDIYRTRYGTETWVKMGDAPTGLRAGARHPTQFNELLLAGTVGGTMHYSPNFGASFTDASNDVSAGSIDHSREWQVGLATHDGFIFPSSLATVNQVRCGTASGIGALEPFLYFGTVNLPGSASITAAYIKITAYNAKTGTLTMDIYGEDADDPAVVTTYADYNSRARTTATEPWSPEDFTLGVVYNSADISSIIQEIVDRPGWSTGNAMQFFVEYNSSGGQNNERQFRSVDTNPDDAPVLYVEYNSSGGLINAIEVSL